MAEKTYLAPTKQAPDLKIPNGSTAVNVRIIDSTTRMTLPAAHLVLPEIGQHNTLSGVPSFSFLIEHPSGRKLVFDLGLRKDFKNLPSVVQTFLAQFGWEITVQKNVSEILEENGVPSSTIEAVIWSHHHFDHVGDMCTFPSSTKIIVGPGFKSAYLPGWPTNENSSLAEKDWENRTIQELSYESTSEELSIGSFRAVDLFGDGSYYILDSPGHTVGHIAALARVTVGGQGASSDTFVLMGGDTCHFAGQFRPTQYRPLPVEVVLSPLPHIHARACPGSMFQDLHPHKSATEPFYEMPQTSTVDLEAAHESILKLQQFDAADNVLVVIAHDEFVVDGIEFFPNAINQWKEKGYSEKVRWQFLSCFCGDEGHE
ncbi:beta-lactamase-like protein [Lipomyces chichibuensis]|uniref:beta-lactamase-like protein n=1 Tax=Lipomyces chichibuensis TaxID=1546026 RepID=UPI0033439375